MRKLLFFALISMLAVSVACDKDDDDDGHNHGGEMTEFEYHAHIMSPDTIAKHVGDTMHIHVDFESHAGETVHHVKVRIYNKADKTEIYDMPSVAHVHEMDGMYSYHDDFVLSGDNGVSEHTDWVLEAKVWGHEAGDGEVMETLEFHVHPE